MSKVLVTESNLANIANAIRGKNGQAAQYKPGEMAAAIEAITTGITPSGTVNIAQNGTTDVTDYASAAVNVQPVLQQKTVTQNGTVTADSGYDGLSSVTVNVSSAEQQYTKLEYIETQGAQYIDTGVKGNQDTEADLHVWITAATATNDFFFGARDGLYSSTTTKIINSFVGVFVGDTVRFDKGTDLINVTTSFYLNGRVFQIGYGAFTELLFSLRNTATVSVVGAGGRETSTANVGVVTPPPADFETMGTLYIGGVNDIQYGIRYATSGTRFCSVTIYDGKKVIRNFIPAKDSNNVVCMYDSVTNAFFYNRGTGSFLAGPVVS